MKLKITFLLFVFVIAKSVMAQGPYEPAADSLGSHAIHMDSNIIIDWVNQVSVVRGLQKISNSSGPLATTGDESLVNGKANGAIVSLGDGGYATANVAISDHDGYDFAVFENGFYDLGNQGYFLELAFVEVSSNGHDFFRFPCHSLTPEDVQTGIFGITDPTNLDGFAGKYRMTYGTPFDLSVMDTVVGLDIYNITQIRIVDVIGNVNPTYTTYDSYGNRVNDPWPTEFDQGGFDLDAIALIDSSLVNSVEPLKSEVIKVYPNPVQNQLVISGLERSTNCEIAIINVDGQVVYTSEFTGNPIDVSMLSNGVYFLSINTDTAHYTSKLVKL